MDPLSLTLYREIFSPEAFAGQVHSCFPKFPMERIQSVPHHMAHAASAYYTSGWDECLVVVVDGMGEADSSSVYRAADGKLTRIHRISAQDSIGILYSLVTLHLGFDFNSDEYKIMGLAPYGDPSRYRAFFEQALIRESNGSIRIPMLRLNRTRDERENYLASRKYLGQELIPERHPDEEIRPEHCDVAAALQECLDKTIQHICGHFGKATGLRRLAMAGGVALNCTANGKLMRSGLFDEIYVQPAAADDGTALGAALWRSAARGAIHNMRSPVPFFGPMHSPAAIEESLQKFSNSVDVVRFQDLTSTCAAAAKLIAEGRVVAWYRGRMEYGPRALGHRSILADPGHPEMRDRINAMVKMREAFRPFAPAVTIEQAHEYFEVAPMTELPYMIVIGNVRQEFRECLPAVTHVDGSARIQTVSGKDNAEFHALLREVGKVLGREMLLNTSFNVKGQPIVNTPEEAIETFLRTGIDCLFLENTLVRRRD